MYLLATVAGFIASKSSSKDMPVDVAASVTSGAA
jgi:hypothetical protein